VADERRPRSDAAPRRPSAVTVELALAAARSVGGALVGVDLLPTSDGGPTILEVNGSVEFTHDYRVGRDVFRAVVLELARVALEAAPRDRPTGADPVLA
jgi:glutathione synthase/RimK-type ligase-like ATP-grasp enzyme